MLFSVVITVHEGDCRFLPHCINGLMMQTFKDFEVLIMVDGLTPLSYDPEKILKETIAGRVIYTDKANTCGFRQRNLSMKHCNGEYIAWLNADNLVYPNWLQNHADNINKTPGCISVVNIHYWHKDNFYQQLPTELYLGKMDLLNYVLPNKLAQEIDAFCSGDETDPCADFYAFARARGHATVVWEQHQPLCGSHF